MNKIDFRVPLTGSMLFDFHQRAVVHELLRKFPELECEENYEGNVIRISGELEQERYDEWHDIVFYNKPL